MSIDSQLLDRVRTLLALASSPNVHEAASAAAMAQTLIERHRLQGWLDARNTPDCDPIEDGLDTPEDIAAAIDQMADVQPAAWLENELHWMQHAPSRLLL